jgi:hypothetical protein
MYFLACLLTIQFPTPQVPFTFAEQPQLRRDIEAALFSSGERLSHLLTVACLSSDEHTAILRLTLTEGHRTRQQGQFLQTLALGQPLHFCQRHGEVVAFDLSDPRWAGLSTWADMQSDECWSVCHLTLATPLITAAPQPHDAPDALPFPEPDVLFTLAAEHWQTLSGQPFPCSASELVQTTHCVLANYQLSTVDIPLPSAPRIGYVGWMDYTCLRAGAEETATLAALARLAFFTGWGYDTSAGFGIAQAVLRERGG